MQRVVPCSAVAVVTSYYAQSVTPHLARTIMYSCSEVANTGITAVIGSVCLKAHHSDTAANL
eukprot:5455-Heterococcus_DN1.PRE.2